MNCRKQGFSLVELLVVIGTISILMGMILTGSRGDERDAHVRGAAMELAATLRGTRQRAMATSQSFAVVFNIQNAPGSSGAVLNNRTGGHWYRVLGPSQRTRFDSGLRHLIPWSEGRVATNRGTDAGLTGNFPDLIADVEASWVDSPHILPPGRVRFLALGDTDEGPRFRGSPQIFYTTGGQTTYPRPWFGYFDTASGRLWPWGGYETGNLTSGFCYQGTVDPAIVGSVNPSDRVVNHDWDRIDYTGAAEDPANGRVVIADVDRNGDGDTNDLDEREVNYPLWRKDEPRPLVNAAWLDATMIFLPDGTVVFGEWNRARRFYTRDIPAASNTSSYFRGASGIPDRAMPTRDVAALGGAIPGPWTLKVFTDRDRPSTDQIPEVAHFTRHTGGWHLTMGPDTQVDRTTFTTATEALESILPAYRVFVSAQGVVRVFRVQRRPGFLASLPATGTGSRWPSSPASWADTSTISSNCRLGYLHRTNDPSVPTGSPILDVVDPAMLSERVWWRQ